MMHRSMNVRVNEMLLLLLSTLCVIRVSGMPTSKCDRILHRASQNSTTEGASPFEVNECLADANTNSTNCTFYIDDCETPCPFGYQVDANGCPYENCSCAPEGMFEGDIKFDLEDIPFMSRVYNPVANDGKADGAANDRPIWNVDRVGGRVKIGYVLGPGLLYKTRSAIREAIDRFSRSTCIDFLPKTNQPNYIVFIGQRGCWSFVGRRGGAQLISIGRGCEHTGIVQHELLHALGFWHEQSRPDRDDYVEILFKNVRKERSHNFRKRTMIDSLGSEYDKKSIMHYDGYAFSSNDRPTILDKATGKVLVAQRDDLSKSDLYQVNKMYECEEELSKMHLWAEWQVWSACSKTCGTGARSRVRTCMRDHVQVAEIDCDGESLQSVNCSTTTCEDAWESWQSWSICSATCGRGYQWRRRTCRHGQNCDERNLQVRFCNNTVDCMKALFSELVVLPIKIKCAGDVILSDSNNDGKDDILCFGKNGSMEIYQTNHAYPFVHKLWEGVVEKCDGERHSGDYDGDGFEDILCVDRVNGSLHVTAGEGGSFASTPIWSGSLGTFCMDGVIQTAYADRDKRKDIVCLHEDGGISAMVHAK